MKRDLSRIKIIRLILNYIVNNLLNTDKYHVLFKIKCLVLRLIIQWNADDTETSSAQAADEYDKHG